MRLHKLDPDPGQPPRILIERAPAAGASWTPNTDVYCVEGGLVIKVELAGLRKEDLELTVEARRLRISGVRRDSCRAGQQCLFVVMEINYGAFETVVEVPPGYDLTSARAAYQNGFLRVDVPVAARREPLPFVVPVEDEGEED
jgi:HSP20 family protein